MAVVVFFCLLILNAPYGRFVKDGFGPRLSNRLGWLLMEMPAVGVFGLIFGLAQRTDLLSILFLLLWQVHYLHRSLIFPFRLRGERKQTTWLIVLFGMIFNSGNAYLNARYLFVLGPLYEISWLADPRFVVGISLFVLGFGVNKHSDHILLGLQEPHEVGYKIPFGGFFQLISSPNYLGELIQWAGWALLTWSMGGLAFFVWTAANLVPRALANHRWYAERFVDYPQDRKALIPFLL